MTARIWHHRRTGPVHVAISPTFQDSSLELAVFPLAFRLLTLSFILHVHVHEMLIDCNNEWFSFIFPRWCWCCCCFLCMTQIITETWITAWPHENVLSSLLSLLRWIIEINVHHLCDTVRLISTISCHLHRRKCVHKSIHPPALSSLLIHTHTHIFGWSFRKCIKRYRSSWKIPHTHAINCGHCRPWLMLASMDIIGTLMCHTHTLSCEEWGEWEKKEQIYNPSELKRKKFARHDGLFRRRHEIFL
jgi:hypothetical protein